MKSLSNITVEKVITVQENISTPKISLDTSYQGALEYGQMAWDNIQRTLNIGLGNGVIGQSFQELYYPLVLNNTLSTILNGTAVGVCGYDVNSGKVAICPFIADGSMDRNLFLGIATEDIAPGASGYITFFGHVNNINTSAFNANDEIYVSDAEAGKLVNTAPISPSFKIEIGRVITSNEISGKISVRIYIYPDASEVTYDNSYSGLVSTNVAGVIDELNLKKADVSLLSSNIILYATKVNADVTGYYKLVSSVNDPDYSVAGTTISSGSLTEGEKVIATFVASPRLFEGNPGVINITTMAEIAKTAGNNNAYGELTFKMYQRTQEGTEVLVATSSSTGIINPISLNDYALYSSTAVLNNGTWLPTDRVVIKWIMTLVAGVNPSYSLKIGGINPARTLIPVPVSVIPSDYAEDILVDTASFAGILNGSDSNVQLALNKIDDHVHDTRYTKTSDLISVGTSNTTSGASKIGIYDEFNYSNGLTVQKVLDDIDNTLYTHIGSTGASHGVATTSVNGFMSSTDKTKLDNATANSTASTLVSRDASSRIQVSDVFLTDNNAYAGNIHNDLQHNGIPEIEKSKWAISYNASTRILTLTISSTSYYYVNGKKFDLATGTYTWTAHANTSGLYFFYFDSTGARQVSNTTWDILNIATVATVFYNSANDGGSPAGILGNEMHGMVMSPAMHKYLHITEGTRLVSGGGISGYILNESTTTAITWTTSDSVIADEDIMTTIPSQMENNYILGYLDASNIFNWKTTQPLPIFKTATDIQYNQIGVGLTAITSNNTYVNYYVVLTNAVDSAYRTMIIPGQQIYNSLTEAQAESPANLNLSYIPFQEYVFLYQITYVRTSGGSTDVGKASIAANPVRQGISRSIITGSASNHNILSDRNVFGAHLAGAIATDDASFTGILQPAIDISVQTALEKLSTRAIDKNIFNTAGDILYASADNTPAILPKGTDGQVLKLSSGIPTWGIDNNTTYSVSSGLTSSGTVFSLGTPSQLTATTTNSASGTTHTHSISTASAVSLSDTSTNTIGTSVSLARADHTHSISGFALAGHNHDATYQPLDADLTAIAGLTGTTGFLKKTAANTWSLDTNSYLNLTGGALTGTLTTRALVPSASNTYDIGTSSAKYKNGYFQGILSVDGGATIGGTLTVNNLTVNGTTTTVNSTTITIDDPVFTLGGDTAPTADDNKDRGIEYRWHNGTTAKIGFFGFDDSTGYFTFIPDATNTGEVFSGTKGTIDANLNGNASTVSNGVYTTGSYSDPSWLTISKAKVGLSNVENTALSTWAGTTNITTVGAITATSINKVNITQPSTTATLTIANGKTFTVNNTLTLSGTDGSTLNIGTGGALGTGAFTSAYIHPNDGGGSISTTLTGASVVATIVVNALGHITGTSTRNLTPSDIGASPTAGNTSLTTLGTVSTGTWNATTIAVNKGGTGLTSYAVGDLLYASGTTTLAKLADVATGNVLLSSGVGVAPSYGKVGLTTHVSGILGVGNGGTGTSTAFTKGSVVFANTSGVYTQDNANLFYDDTNNRLGVGTATPAEKLHTKGNVRIDDSAGNVGFVMAFDNTTKSLQFNYAG
jgi:hypothetical protein